MTTYGQLPVHRWMLRDLVRNEAYRAAITSLVKPGDVVLDMGTGTGILSIFAAAAGARKVYAVERTAVAEVASRVVEQNGHAARIEVLRSDVEDVALPEKVDVLVSEWMGGFGVDENLLAPLVMTRDRWLKPGGKIIPGRVTAFLAPASIPEFDADIAYWRSRPHGVDLGVIAQMTTHEIFQSQVELRVEDLLAAPQVMWSHDPYTCSLDEADRSFTTELAFVASRAGTVSAFVAWFAAEMGDGGTLTNAVGAPDTHWGRTLFPLNRPIEVAAGARLAIALRCDQSVAGSCEQHWAVQVDAGPREEHDTRRAEKDRLSR